MEFTAVMRDADGNPIDLKCKCGKPADTAFIGKEAYQGVCNDCLYPVKPEEAKFTYVEWGGGWPEEFKKRMEERMEKAKKILGEDVKPRKWVDPSLRGTPEFDAQIREWTKDMYKDKEGNRISIEELCVLTADEAYKVVAQEHVHEFWVSTVWLGVKHFNDAFFETMIFSHVNPDLTGEWESHALYRYKTLKEASDGHEKVVKLLREACERYAGDSEKIIEVVEDGTH